MVLESRVADPHHCNADLDPHTAFHFKADPDPAFHFKADPDPAPHQNDAYQRPVVYKTSRAPILSLHASIVSFNGILKFLSFDFNANPDPAFHTDVGPDPDPASKNNADPDPQPCSKK
jgi:hypothetical protein